MLDVPSLETIVAEGRRLIGSELHRRVSAPVTLSDIRRWAIAVYWPETPPRQFWDEAAAAQTRFGGIVAPAELNPLAWPLDPEHRFPPRPVRPYGNRTFNAGTEVDYFEPIRPGDTILSVAVLKDFFVKYGSSGPLLFEVREDTWTNQTGALVKRLRSTLIYSEG